jgi:hypothetical protein
MVKTKYALRRSNTIQGHMDLSGQKGARVMTATAKHEDALQRLHRAVKIEHVARLTRIRHETRLQWSN